MFHELNSTLHVLATSVARVCRVGTRVVFQITLNPIVLWVAMLLKTFDGFSGYPTNHLHEFQHFACTVCYTALGDIPSPHFKLWC